MNECGIDGRALRSVGSFPTQAGVLVRFEIVDAISTAFISCAGDAVGSNNVLWLPSEKPKAPILGVIECGNVKRRPMPNVVYEIVQHDGGWAYKVNGVFSEPFPTHSEALAAAQVAAAEQEIPGHGETIEYEDDRGKWHTEAASGQDRPHAVVRDKK